MKDVPQYKSPVVEGIATLSIVSPCALVVMVAAPVQADAGAGAVLGAERWLLKPLNTCGLTTFSYVRSPTLHPNIDLDAGCCMEGYSVAATPKDSTLSLRYAI